MSLKLQVGISKKIGLPDYGSFGASCQIETELEASLNPRDIEEHVQQAYSACRQAVEDELTRGRPPAPRPSNRNGTHPAGDGESNGRNGHEASPKQLAYIEQLAGQIRGLGARRLEGLSTKMYSKPPASLSSLEASGLIDVLKEIKTGKMELSAALGGTSP